MTPRGALPAVLAAVAGIALFSIMDALMKRASIAVGAFDAVLWRNLFGSLLAAAMWLASGWRSGWPAGFRPDLPRLAIHFVRSAVVAGMAVLFFYGLVRTPMAQGMAITFIAPLIALYLAALFLGEPVTRRAVVASLLALAGVGVIAFARSREGPAAGPEAMLGLAAILFSAVLYAVNLVLQRHQAQRASPIEIAFFQNLFVGFVLLLALPWLGGGNSFTAAAPAVLVDLAAAATLATASLMLLAWAYARAEAHRLLPVEYSAFVWSALMGRLWFGEAVTVATLAGVVLIVGGCVIGTRSSPQEQSAL